MCISHTICLFSVHSLHDIPAEWVSKRFTTTASELGMSEDKETPLGVKMLADHLVKVKMQYEGGDWENLVLIE